MATTSAPLPVHSPRPNADPRLAMLGITVWGVLVFALASAGAITLERRFLLPVLVLGSIIALIALYYRSAAMRALADGVDLRALVALHAIRAPIGIGLVVLVNHGLDPEFGRIAGYGDAIVGVLALVAAAFVGMPTERFIVRGWNALGLADLLLVVLTAQRIVLFSDHPQTMSLMLRFPMAALPLFVVPLALTTHLLIFRRTSRSSVPGGESTNGA